MNLKEDIDKRLKAGFSKKEITSHFIDKGHSKEEIHTHFPKIKRTSVLYVFILIWSALISIGLLGSNIYFSGLFSLSGIIAILLCIGTFLMYKMNRIGFVIHMVFYTLFIIVWFIGFIYYNGNGPDIIKFSLWSFVVVLSIGSFFIGSLHSLFKKC